MGHGLQVFDESGQLAFDSSLCRGGVCAGIITIPPNRPVFQYPFMPTGRTVRVIFMDINKRNFVYTEPGGVPTLSFAASQSPRNNFAGVFFI